MPHFFRAHNPTSLRPQKGVEHSVVPCFQILSHQAPPNLPCTSSFESSPTIAHNLSRSFRITYVLTNTVELHFGESVLLLDILLKLLRLLVQLVGYVSVQHFMLGFETECSTNGLKQVDALFSHPTLCRVFLVQLVGKPCLEGVREARGQT